MNNEPVHVLSLGVGIQSTRIALGAAIGDITPMPMAAIFADTKNESGNTYRYLDWLEKQLPFPVYRVSHGDLRKDSLVNRTSKKTGNVYTKNMIPFFISGSENKKYESSVGGPHTLWTVGKKGMLMRKCTADYKIKAIEKKLRELVKPQRGCREVKVIQWIGISTDEAHRMKPPKRPWIHHRWPLIELSESREGCINWLSSHGYPLPSKSSCVFCPFHNDSEWLRIKNDEPDEFNKAVQFEMDFQKAHTHQTGTARLKGIAYLHRSCVPLDQVLFDKCDPKRQLNLFGSECEGVCGI